MKITKIAGSQNKYIVICESDEDVNKLLNINSKTDSGAQKQSLKANEVMNILNISRVTLCHYIKRGLIKIDTNYTGKQYRYNYDSVMQLKNK